MPWREAVDLENRVLMYGEGEVKTISKLTGTLKDFVRVELLRSKFLTGMRSKNILGAKPDLLAQREDMRGWFISFKGLFHNALLHLKSSFGILTSIV